jgi:hypothetical protein
VYSSAKIVLADHWPDMREHGYISNRIYDALASGAMVLSDPVGGLEERFGGSVAVYRSREELRSQIDLLLGDEEGRRARARKGCEIVADTHTFERRVDVLLEHVGIRWEELGRRCGITAPFTAGSESCDHARLRSSVGPESIDESNHLTSQYERAGQPPRVHTD